MLFDWRQTPDNSYSSKNILFCLQCPNYFSSVVIRFTNSSPLIKGSRWIKEVSLVLVQDASQWYKLVRRNEMKEENVQINAKLNPSTLNCNRRSKEWNQSSHTEKQISLLVPLKDRCIISIIWVGLEEWNKRRKGNASSRIITYRISFIFSIILYYSHNRRINEMKREKIINILTTKRNNSKEEIQMRW